MYQRINSHNPRTLNSVFRAVKNQRRRRVLSLLLGRPSPVDVEDLCVELAAMEEETSLRSVSDESVQSMRTDLHHVHLPILEETALVRWDRTAETVTTSEAPVLIDEWFVRILETDVPKWDEVLASLAHRRRRVVLSVLGDHDGAMDRRTLATAVADRTAADESSTEDLRVSLSHVDLPKLQQAGLVRYDADAGTVSHEGHPALDESWFAIRSDEPSRPAASTPAQTADVHALDGREALLAHAHTLFEEADDELFIMATTDGLIAEACLRRLQDALDRGVDVYVGSQTASVRDCVRERLPEAVIWEPQMDWLNLPPNYDRIGRLVLADRNAILLGTLGGGDSRETGLTGRGEDNPLVVLMRDLLGSRLDHLDAQSADFRSRLPL